MNFRRIAKSIVAGVGGALAGGGFGFLVWWFIPPPDTPGFGGIGAGAAFFQLLVLLVCLGAGLGGLIGVAWSLRSKS